MPTQKLVNQFDPSDAKPALEIANSNNTAALRIHQEGTGNAIEIVDAGGNVLQAFDRRGSGPQPSYLISTSGGTVSAIGNPALSLATITPSADAAAVLQACLNALVTAAGNAVGQIVFAQGTYDWHSIPTLPRVATGTTPDTGSLVIRGAGRWGGGTKIRLNTDGQRFLDPGKVADHDWFGNFELADFLIDCNNIGGQHHVVFGGYMAGVQLLRWNLENWKIRGIRTTNVPVDSTLTNHRLNVFVTIRHTALNEATENYCKNGRVEDVRFEGGNQGVFVGGAGPASGVVNVLIDDITVDGFWHSLLVVPTVNTSSGHVQIGSRAHGGKYRIRNGYGYGSMDVGSEVDAGDDVVVEDITYEEGINAPFYTTNLQPPRRGAHAQKVTFRRCVARWSSTRTQECHAFRIIGYEGNDLGHYEAFDCEADVQSAEWTNLGGEWISVEGQNVSAHNIQSLTVENFTGSKTAISSSSSSNVNPALINLDSLNGECVVRLKNINGYISGAYSGTGIIGFRYVQIQGGTVAALEIDGLHLSNQVTGLTSGVFSSKMLDLGLGTAITLRTGSINRLSQAAPASSVTVAGVTIRGTGTLTIGGRILIDDSDLSQVPSGSGIVSFVTANQNKDRVFLGRNRDRTLPVPDTTNGRFNATTFTSAVANQYLGGFACNAILSGGVNVTSVDIVVEGTTVNVLTQAAGAIPAGFAPIYLNNADSLKITLSSGTSFPTVTTVPVK